MHLPRNRYPPQNLISIGYAAFYGCASLTSVTLPESLTSIAGFAFNGCTVLNSVEILSNGTSDTQHVIYLGSSSDKTAIGYSVFPRNQATLTYDPNTTWIGENENQNLRYYFSDIALSDSAGWSYDYATNTLTLSGSVVAWSAIKIFSSTTENVVFAEDYKVPDIPSEAFLDFSKLKAVELPDVVESIGTDAFYRCSSLASVTLPSSVTSIGPEAFYGCSSLASVTLPSSITSIDECVFGNCTSLATVTLPKNLISIGFAAFNGCTSLTSVTLPESLTSIDDFAFGECTSLNSIEILSDGTSDNKHVIHLGSGSDKTARGYNVFPRNQATLKYDPTTTWIGDDDTQNFRYYFSVFEVPTSIHQTEISTSAPQFYDLGGRPVSPTSHQGLAVKRQGNNSSLITIK